MTDKIKQALDLAEDALDDLYNGWLYIRETHGELCGVGWDRAESKAEKALDAVRAAKIELELIKNKQIEDSWRNNPDRSGGQFTQDEINNKDWYH